MKLTTKVVQKSAVTLVLEPDEVQWLRDILCCVAHEHLPSNILYDALDNLPGIEGGVLQHGFRGLIDYKEPT